MRPVDRPAPRVFDESRRTSGRPPRPESTASEPSSLSSVRPMASSVELALGARGLRPAGSPCPRPSRRGSSDPQELSRETVSRSRSSSIRLGIFEVSISGREPFPLPRPLPLPLARCPFPFPAANAGLATGSGAGALVSVRERPAQVSLSHPFSGVVAADHEGERDDLAAERLPRGEDRRARCPSRAGTPRRSG